MLARALASSAQVKAPTTIDHGFSISLFSVVSFVALKNLGLLIKSDWSVICLLYC